MSSFILMNNNNNILERISIDFDIKNHHELSPWIFYSDISQKAYQKSRFERVQGKHYRHLCLSNNLFETIENFLYTQKYYGKDKEKMEEYKNLIIKKLNILFSNQSRAAIENIFTIYYEMVFDLVYDSHYYWQKFKKIIKKDFKQMPISTALFPHYHQLSSNYFFYDDTTLDNRNNENNLKIEQHLTEIVDKYVNNDIKSIYMIKFDDLHQILDILSDHTKAFSFSPTFVLSMIDNFNKFLEILFNQNNQNNENVDNDFMFFNEMRKLPSNEDKQTKIKYFGLIMIIKMLLYLIIQKTHEALSILLQFIILEQENYNFEDNFSLKSIFSNSLPNTNKRTKMIQDISIDHIIDYYCSHNEKNGFILTKEGIYKIDQTSKLEKIKVNEHIAEKLISCDKNDTKIAFSNGILYILSRIDNKIHKIMLPNNEEEVSKPTNNQKYFPVAKENDLNKRKKKRMNKRLREMQKKEKKKQRKNEKKEETKNEINLDSVSIDIPEFPIVSVGVFDNYFRILQRKDYNKGKTTFILTNIDLTPNTRIDYNILKAFEKDEDESQIKQTQFQITINDKCNKYKLCDASFSKDSIFFSFEDSSFEQWMIFRDGTANIYKHFLSPYLFTTNSRLKFDNDSFLYIMEPIQNEDKNLVSIIKMYLPETRYYIRSDSRIFIKYPYLQKLSDIVDNCSHFIVNREVTKTITTDEYYKANDPCEKKNKDKQKPNQKKLQLQNPFSFVVSPEEMSTIIQSPTAIALKLDELKELISEIKDNELKTFLISLFIKMCGINLLYGTRGFYSSKEKLDENGMRKFEKFRTFIMDLFLSDKSNDSLLQESFIFTISLSGKFLFLPNQYDQMHNLIDEMVCSKSGNFKFLLRTLSHFIFSYPSSFYIINNSIFNHLLEFDNIDLNMNELIMKNLCFIDLEGRFALKIMNSSFAQFISPYFESLFAYIDNMLKNESISLVKIEQLISYLLIISINKIPLLSLTIEKGLVQIAPSLYDRVKKEPGVIESDHKFLEHFSDLLPQTVYKEVKYLESEHPLNIKANEFEEKENIIEDLGVIAFGSNIDTVYAIFDNRCRFSSNDKIIFYTNNNVIKYDTKNLPFNQAIILNGNLIRVKLERKKGISDEDFWGYRIQFVGTSFDQQFNWISNKHLFFYDSFISVLTQNFLDANFSTPINKKEKELDSILTDKIIQGIKIEEIENVNQNQQNVSHDKQSFEISKGIAFDIDKTTFDENEKTAFLNEMIDIKDDNSTKGKKFLDILYNKTMKKNRIKLNKNTMSILENERYFAACLFKHVGLISTCIKFINETLANSAETEIPAPILAVWKKIYSLRQTLFLSYQKTKSASGSQLTKNSIKLNFQKYSEEMKRKCILLFYSDPILKLKEKDSFDSSDKLFESVLSSIFSFITSEITLSEISTFIDARRERLSFMTNSLKTLSGFIEQNKFFESSKLIFANQCENLSKNIYKIKGVTNEEYDEYHELFEKTVFLLLTQLFHNPSTALLSKMDFLDPLLSTFSDEKDIKYDFSQIFINVLEKNQNDKTFLHNITNLQIIKIIIQIIIRNKNAKLIDYIISLLFRDEIDIISKKMILILIPIMIDFIPGNSKIKDKSFALSFLAQNYHSPILTRASFYWLASIYNLEEEYNSLSYDFIMKVLKGIGLSFSGKSCLFIDDNFQSFTHRQVAEGMISFIVLLANSKNKTMRKVINDILLSKINQIKLNNNSNNENEMILIGLFSSIGQSLSAFEPERKMMSTFYLYDENMIIGFNPTLKKIRKMDCCRPKIKGSFTNAVLVNANSIELSQNEIENILQLHENIMNSMYFNEEPNYLEEIKDKEISDSILISSFYSFLPMIFQNKNNADILMNKINFQKTLSLFKFSTYSIPSEENSIIILSHYLENAITNPMYKANRKIDDNRIDSNGCFRFMKMNFGEIIYNNENNIDIIKTTRDHFNVFLASRPFDSKCETYFEVKIKNIGNKQIFIGFVDSEESSLHKAFGFGSAGQSEIFCRRSSTLSKHIEFCGDKVMKHEQISIKEGDKIGCYYTCDYVYLTLNGILTKYRLSHKQVNSYIPIIYIDHDEIELEIIQNVSIVGKSNIKFNFLNVQNEHFKEKDITKSVRKTDSVEKSKECFENQMFIGQNIYIDRTICQENQTNMETIEPYSPEILQERENYAIIKDIIPNNDNRFVSKLIIETYNHLTLSKEIFSNVDSRNLSFKKTNFFNLVENRMNTKFGLNNFFTLKHLPNELQTTSNFDSISNYIRNKTIKENSKSIAIIMTRYLSFILTDYLRFIKSPLLQDDGIESEEMNCILHSLAISIPTITNFRPKFTHKIDKDDINSYLIFASEDEEKNRKRRRIRSQLFKPGFYREFNEAFQVFLMKSEHFISKKFINKLLQISIDKALSCEILSCSSLYSQLPPKWKVESIDPLPEKLEYSTTLKKKKLRNSTPYVGYIPIILDKIPDQLPAIQCANKDYKESSDVITYFSHVIDDITIEWKYELKEMTEPFDREKYQNYKLKFGLLLLPKKLPENLLNSSLSFIQILLNIFQIFNISESLFDKHRDFLRGELLEKIFQLAMKKDPLLHQFLQIIMVMLISKYGFSDSMFSVNASNAMIIFNSLSNKLFPIYDFPTGKNELPLLFSIYTNLIQTRIHELLNNNQNEENLSKLFDKYNTINKELFMIDLDDKFDEKEDKSKSDNFTIVDSKKKNFRLFYLLYYYSYLLHSDRCLPYPMFLFVHDWMMQRYGGFRTTISKRDINKFTAIKIDENKEIIYKSNVLNNDFDLSCSYQLCNIYVNNEKDENKKEDSKSSKHDFVKNNEKSKDKEKSEIDSNKVFVHQLSDDKQIEIPQSGESINVSFPLEILIVHENDTQNKTRDLKLGDVFIINFSPSESLQKKTFIKHYENIQNDFQQFNSLEKYDSSIMESFNNIDEKEENQNENTLNTNDNNSIDSNENMNIGKDDYKIYQLQKIPLQSEISLKSQLPAKDYIASLRYSMISKYRYLIENLLVTYTIDKDKDDDDDEDGSSYTNWWRNSSYSNDKPPNKYMQQIIGPAYSMNTDSKFVFINKILSSENKEDYELRLIFNRFEQQKYFDANNESSSKLARPLIIQLMEQLDEDSISLLKVRGGRPFSVKLVGEGAIDAGGPAREIFSSLIVEMMNDKISFFTYNPNRIRQNKDTNMEDLIPNKKIVSENFSEEAEKLLNKRFVYAGALLASCIVSSLPQTMKLSSFIWEYLTNGNISIESIYEIDEDFKKLMNEAESLESKVNSMSDELFNKCFNHSFEIKDSQDKVVELIQSGSEVPVTKDNLHEFINLAKNYRIHEFDDELNDMKEGFDKIMIYKNITSILRPNELKLLVCGEMNCSVEQMKKVMDIETPSLKDEKINEEQMKEMFWNVMESFSVDERMLFIRFSSGNLGLPAPGLKWEDSIKIYISTRKKKEKENKTLVTSSTCSSEARIPFFECEDELAKMIRISLKFFGMINDGKEELGEVEKEFF